MEIKETNNLAKKIIKSIIFVFIIILILICSLFFYDKITINNKYSINEANINIPIFLYHNIVNTDSEIKYDYMQTTKETFEKQIDGLLKSGYHFITYNELEKYKNNEIELYKKSCILTFDDGLEGVYENAYPIAQKYNIPFTMFVVINNIGQEECITWEQAKEMQNSGLVTIASHSTEHADFRNLTTEEAVQNVNNTYKLIEEKLGSQPIKIFTYPYGLYKEEQNIALEKENYIQNLTDNKINNSKNLDLSRLHRCYPLNDSVFKIKLKILYRSIRYSK